MDEQVDLIRYRHDGVVDHHPLPRRIVFQEAVDVFGHIENDNDQNQHRDGKKESAKILLEDICVYFSHSVSAFDKGPSTGSGTLRGS